MDKEPTKTLLQLALDNLPSRRGVISNAHKALAAKGRNVTIRHLYDVVKGRNKKPDLIEAILDAVEEAKNRTASLDARARALAEA